MSRCVVSRYIVASYAIPGTAVRSYLIIDTDIPEGLRSAEVIATCATSRQAHDIAGTLSLQEDAEAVVNAAADALNDWQGWDNA